MKLKKLFLSVGLFLLVSALFINLQHSLNNYGIGTNSQHLEILAQSSSSGDGGGTGDPSLWKIDIRDCTAELIGEVGTSIKILGRTIYFGSSKVKVTFYDVATYCESGGGYQCSTKDCASFWKDSGATVGSET